MLKHLVKGDKHFQIKTIHLSQWILSTLAQESIHQGIAQSIFSDYTFNAMFLYLSGRGNQSSDKIYARRAFNAYKYNP